MATANDRLFANAVRHQIGLVRYSTSTVKKIIAMLNRSQVRILDQLAKFDPSEGDGSFSQQRLESLLVSLRSINAEGLRAITEAFDGDLRDLGTHEVEFTARAFDTLVPIELNVIQPTREQLYAAVHAKPFRGKLLSEYYGDLPEATMAPVRSAIRQGFAEGRTTDQIIRELRGSRAAKYTDGILQQPRRSVERLVRTAINHTATVAREQVYKENADLVKGVRWVSTLDMRTSDICQALDGEVFPPDDGPRPPAHLNCRSTTSPVLKSWEELGFEVGDLPEGTRASMDGQVPASMTYQEWLSGQSEAVQDDVLGPTRAALFRDGGLTLDKFVDEANRSLTLEQLRAREEAAFRRAKV